MNKFFGKKTDFIPVREDASRIIISYEKKDVDETNCTWYEVYFYKSKKPNPSFIEVKEAVLNDINAQTDEKILTQFRWTLTKGWKLVNGQKVDLTGETVNVWLSNENQNNYSEAHSIAKEHADEFLPVTFKVSEDSEEIIAIYEDFEDYATLDRFYLSAAAFKNNTLKEGWLRKDSIDWTEYSVFFPVTE